MNNKIFELISNDIVIEQINKLNNNPVISLDICLYIGKLDSIKNNKKIK